MVTISGGMYPIACVVVRPGMLGLAEGRRFCPYVDHGGAELGCLVAMKTLEILQRPVDSVMVNYISEMMRNGLTEIAKLYSDFFVGIRQCGVVMGLEFDYPRAQARDEASLRNGVWAIFSTLDPRVLQFKAGILMSRTSAGTAGAGRTVGRSGAGRMPRLGARAACRRAPDETPIANSIVEELLAGPESGKLAPPI